MNVEKLVDDYLDAWNCRDPARLLALMDKRATYYDAFLMEYCAARDLAKYIQDAMAEEKFRFERVGEIISVDNSVVYRYDAHEVVDSIVGPVSYRGADVLVLRDEKIVAVSDYYCNPSDSALAEVARRSLQLRAETRHVQTGLGTLRALRYRRLLSDNMIQKQVYRDADLTQLQLATQIGCSVDHLMQVIGQEYGTSFENFLDQYRVKHAKEMLGQHSQDPDYVNHVALDSGFHSLEKLDQVFRRLVGESPTEFCNHDSGEGDSASERIPQQ